MLFCNVCVGLAFCFVAVVSWSGLWSARLLLRCVEWACIVDEQVCGMHVCWAKHFLRCFCRQSCPNKDLFGTAGGRSCVWGLFKSLVRRGSVHGFFQEIQLRN